jgi:hypothetical protein
MHNRLKIEESILGAIIYHNSFTRIAHILSVNNFSSVAQVKNRELYSVIAGLYPSKPIDLLTVTHELHAKYPADAAIMDTMINSVHNVSSSKNIVEWAFLLLQIDITEKLKKQLSDWKSERERAMDHAATGALLEVIEQIGLDSDVFDLIDNATAYFLSLNMEKEVDQLIQMYQHLTTKVKNIKKMNSINTALSYLFKISEATPQVQYECQALADAIANMVINNEVQPKHKQAADLLNQQ